jgi:hypothetical protein
LQISLIEWGSFANMLSEKEKELIDYVYLKVGHLWVQEIVDKSHSEEWYKATDMFQPIFYWFAESLSI